MTISKKMNRIHHKVDSMIEMVKDSLVLSDVELRDLTGYKHRYKQHRSLSEMDIPFRIGRLGKPIVLRSVMLERFGGTMRPAMSFPAEPDFVALREQLGGS